MSIERADFDSISEKDLQELIEGQVPEGLRVEYKVTTYGNADADKREFLKDVSAMANSHGGHLILGMEETAGNATKVIGIGAAVDADSEILRLERIARSGLEPRLSGLRIKAIPLEKGGNVLLLRIPRSWNPPHRVISQGSNRFYIRHSVSVDEPSLEELRTLFTQSASSLDLARNFRKERITAIKEGRGDDPLANNGRIILHIIPVASFSGAVAIDIRQVYEKSNVFWPISTRSGYSPFYNYNGFINKRGGKENFGYTQIYRNGILEATRSNLLYEDTKHQTCISGFEETVN